MRSMWKLIGVMALVASCASENNFSNQDGLDVWVQSPSEQVDILFVVDDSHSMAEEQQRMASGFRDFVVGIEDTHIDFHLGVVRTTQESEDPYRANLIGDPPYLTVNDDYINGFRERVQVGIDGSDKEKGMQAAVDALTNPEFAEGYNAGFLRANAKLLVIMLSDEDDCSDDGQLDGQPSELCYTARDSLTPVRQAIHTLQALKADPRDVTVSGIIAVDSTKCEAWPGRRYAELTVLTGGVIGDMCESDWSSMLFELGLNAAGILTHFQLSQAADPDTLKVYVDDVESPMSSTNGWTYDEFSWDVAFHGEAVPERGQEVRAEYTVLPGGQRE